ncbi:MAG: hypothetical protein IPM06_21680 [Rhizobiales bacterium]|nr:hypothetical protein [Hyphomicrobiales bacterium]
MNTYHSQIVDALVSIGWTPPPVPPCPPMPARKCVVYGCQNRSDQGKFNDNICWPCYNMLTSGEVGKGTTFIHNLDRNLAAAAQEIEKARPAAFDIPMPGAGGSPPMIRRVYFEDVVSMINQLAAIRKALTSTQENQS